MPLHLVIVFDTSLADVETFIATAAPKLRTLDR
jgi:hypothetical protein